MGFCGFCCGSGGECNGSGGGKDRVGGWGGVGSVGAWRGLLAVSVAREAIFSRLGLLGLTVADKRRPRPGGAVRRGNRSGERSPQPLCAESLGLGILVGMFPLCSQSFVGIYSTPLL